MKRSVLCVLSVAVCVFTAYALPVLQPIFDLGGAISLYVKPPGDKNAARSGDKKEKNPQLTASQTTYFSQDFSSSNVVSSYVSGTPNSGQFNSIVAGGESIAISINGGRLQFAREGSSGFFTRSTDFSPIPTTIKYSVDITVTGNSFAQTNAAVFQVGSGFSPILNTTESTTNTYARFGLNWTPINGQFSIRNMQANTNSGNFTGTQTLTWFINNSGSAISYAGPNGEIESLANDTGDIWIGTTKAHNDHAVTTATQTMSDLKFAFTGGVGTIQLDNIVIEDIPPVPPMPDFVNLQFPSTTSTNSGLATEPIYGRIFEAGVTEAAGDSGSVTAEVGYGPLGSDPTSSPSWTYFPASFNAQVGNDDEYVGTITAPSPPSSTQYAYTYRFSLDGGTNWTYADLNGNGTNPGLSFDPAQLGTLTVNFAEPEIQVTGGPLNFGDQAVNTTSGSLSVTVTNTGEAGLVLGTPTFVTGTQFAFTANPNGTVLTPAESTTISFSFTPTSSGAKNDAVTINSNAGGIAPTITLTGTGIVPSANLSSDPTSVNFGDVTVGGAAANSSIVITNNGSPVDITDLPVTGANAADYSAIPALPLPVTLNNGETLTVNLTFSPSALGSREATLGITSDPASSLTVLVTGNGIRPAMILVVDTLIDDGGLNLCTMAANDCSLRGANSIALDGDTITFDPGLFTAGFQPEGVASEIVLGGSELEITSDITIDGPGADQLTISGNNASRVFSIGAGSTVEISGLTIADGDSGAGNGGGVSTAGTLTTFDSVHFLSNSASNGGALAGTNMVLRNSTLSGNVANISGGAISCLIGSLTIENSTISGNTATGFSGSGGGLFLLDPTVILRSVTITENTALDGGGIRRAGTGGNLHIGNSIIAGNEGTVGVEEISNIAPILSDGFNLIGSASGSNMTFQPTDIENSDPMLGPLQKNGGPTPTHGFDLSLGLSPAIDKGFAFGVTADQREMNRPIDFPSIANAAGGDASDIGAYELLAPSAAPVSISGRVITAYGAGIRGAVVAVQGVDGVTRSVTTNTFGYYRIEELTAGESYVVTVSARRYTFANGTQLVSLEDNVSGLDFMASP